MIKNHGFTLVEMLIVIVVIGILTAVGVVSYTGVQNKARASAARNAAAQAKKAVELYQVQHGMLPVSLADAHIASDTLQYSSNASATPSPTYCITATEGTASYYVNNSTQETPAVGGCPGHGVGGMAAVINLVINPSATSLNGFSSSGTAGSSTIITGSDAYSGSTFIRRTFTGSGGSGIYFGTNEVGRSPVTPGETYCASASMRASSIKRLRIVVEWKNFDATRLISRLYSATTNIGPSWTRLNACGVAPASSGSVTIAFYNEYSDWAAGDYQDVDAIMFTRGSTPYSYADGDSPGWVWNGAANVSTSTGSPL